jgi:hypothetical protein
MQKIYYPMMRKIIILASVACMTAQSVHLKYFYDGQIDLTEDVGKLIQETTNPNDLSIISIEDRKFNDPRILFAARRRGWNVGEKDLSKETVENLKTRGAKFLFLLYPNQYQHGFLNSYKHQADHVFKYHGIPIATIRIYKIQ